MEGGYAAIYETPNYQKFRGLIVRAVKHKYLVALAVVSLFFIAVLGMGFVGKQFFPNSARTEMLGDITLPQGASIEATNGRGIKIENRLYDKPQTAPVTATIGVG